jgi:hypothetical protein
MLLMPSAASHTVISKGTAKVLTAGFEWLGVDAAVMAAVIYSVSNYSCWQHWPEHHT